MLDAKDVVYETVNDFDAKEVGIVTKESAKEMGVDSKDVVGEVG